MNIGQKFNPFKLFVGAFIPNALMKCKKISQGSKLCYARLSQYAGQNGYAYPKMETLADEIGVSLSQVKRYIKELVSYGLITIESPRGKDKLNHLNNKYYFNWHEIFECNELSEQVIYEPSEKTEYEPSEKVGYELEKPTQKRTIKSVRRTEENHIKENHIKENHTYTPDQQKYISILKEIDNYPLDIKKDIQHIEKLEKKYPELDMVEVLESYADWKLDKPLTKKCSPRSQISNQCKVKLKYGMCLKKDDKGTPVKSTFTSKINYD